MNVGVAANLREKMDELEAMTAESNIPVVTELTSWEAEQKGVVVAPAPPPSGGKELVLCRKCFDVPCVCGGSAYVSWRRWHRRGGYGGSSARQARPPPAKSAPSLALRAGAGAGPAHYGGCGGGRRRATVAPAAWGHPPSPRAVFVERRAQQKLLVTDR